MHVTRSTLPLGLAALAVAVAGARAGPAAASPEVIATQQATTTVAAHARRVLWSRFDRERRRFRLVELRAGRVRTLPVPPRRVPFDVDLGRGPDGRPWAVYTRCARDELVRSGAVFVPVPARGRRCAVHALNLVTGRERRLPGTRSRRALARPTVWARRLAYLRLGSGGFEIAVREQGRRARVVDGPGRGAAGGPTSLDLRGARLAFAWRLDRAACPGDEGDSLGSVEESFLFLEDLRTRRRRMLERECLGGGARADDPTLLPGDHLLYLRRSAAARTLHTLDLGSGTSVELPAPDAGEILSVASDGRDVYTTLRVLRPAGETVEVRREGAASTPRSPTGR